MALILRCINALHDASFEVETLQLCLAQNTGEALGWWNIKGKINRDNFQVKTLNHLRKIQKVFMLLPFKQFNLLILNSELVWPCPTGP